MRETKRRHLEARGWKIGSTQEFLGLTEEEAKYVDLKAKLAACLRAKRRKAHLGQHDLAKLVHSSQSRIAKMEAADASVSIDLLIRSLFALGTSKPELARAIVRTSKFI